MYTGIYWYLCVQVYRYILVFMCTRIPVYTFFIVKRSKTLKEIISDSSSEDAYLRCSLRSSPQVNNLNIKPGKLRIVRLIRVLECTQITSQ